MLQFDLKYIQSILKSNFLPDKLTNCLLADKIAQVFSRMNCSCASLFSEYFEEESFQLYCLLKGPDYKETGYEEYRKRKQESINHYTLNCDLQMFKKLIDVCSSISGVDNHSSWEVCLSGTPPRRTSPSSGSQKPAMSLAKVDLPEPEGTTDRKSVV